MQYAIVFGIEDAKTHTALAEFTGQHSSPRP